MRHEEGNGKWRENHLNMYGEDDQKMFPKPRKNTFLTK